MCRKLLKGIYTIEIQVMAWQQESSDIYHHSIKLDRFRCYQTRLGTNEEICQTAWCPIRKWSPVGVFSLGQQSEVKRLSLINKMDKNNVNNGRSQDIGTINLSASCRGQRIHKSCVC